MWRKEMNEVSKKSVNGGSQVSGGFIFDQMDRFAHDYLKKEQNIKGYLFTECAHIYYSKQICDFGNVKIVPYKTCYVGSATEVTVKVVDKKGKKEYATGMFFFVEKEHAYCDTKGGGSKMTPEEYKKFAKMPREYKNGLVRAINDHFENNKQYNVPRAQLIIADIPYNLSVNAFASNPMWYKDGDNKNGESDLAGKSFFNTDEDFRVSNLFHFCSRLLKDEPKEKTGKTGQTAPCMIVFCAFQQMHDVIECAKQYGFNHYIPLQWYKNYSAQVLKANMKVVGNTEYALLFYKNRLPKFNNNGAMVFNNKPWIDDPNTVPKVHSTQKPIGVLKQLILLHTDPDDVVIDPCCGSGSTLAASAQCGRKAVGFEIDKHFFYEMTTKYLPEMIKQKDLF